MPYKLIPLQFAEIECDESILFRRGDKSKKRLIGCYAWLLVNHKEIILIDTGIDNLDIVNKTKRGAGVWIRGEQGKPLKHHLENLGINAKDITKVILTHTHYDHISGISLAQNAQIYLTNDEFESLVDENNSFAELVKSSKDFVLKQKGKGALVLYDDTYEVNKNIYAIQVGGHTKGSSIVVVNTLQAKYIFTGDAVFLIENIEKNCAIGFTEDSVQSEKVLKICKELDGIYLTGHDPECYKIIKDWSDKYV